MVSVKLLGRRFFNLCAELIWVDESRPGGSYNDASPPPPEKFKENPMSTELVAEKDDSHSVQ